MKKFIFVMVIVVLLLGLMTAGIVQAKSPLRGSTEYWFHAHLEIDNGDGLTLLWAGTVHIDGEDELTMKWWGNPGDMRFTGQASHYNESWEILDGDTLLMAGDDAGTTTARHGKNSNWRTNGVITVANGQFEEWLGRQTHMSGHFTWLAPGLPEYGVGIFRINSHLARSGGRCSWLCPRTLPPFFVTHSSVMATCHPISGFSSDENWVSAGNYPKLGWEYAVCRVMTGNGCFGTIRNSV